jgi:putative transposase
LAGFEAPLIGRFSSGPRGLKELEDENRRLKHMVADLSLDREALKAVIRKNGWSL